MRILSKALPMAAIVLLAAGIVAAQSDSLIAEGAEIQELATTFRFTEGPAANTSGTVYFTDIPSNRIHIWTLDGELETFRENSGGANGLYFDASGALLVCEGGARRLTRVTMDGAVEVLADSFEGKKLNSPNDLWPDPKGGIYFTDPRYGNRDDMELGEFVYYLSPDRQTLTKVIDDLVRPNGVLGTRDGKTLYVADQADKKTYSYSIQPDGTLAEKRLFANEGSDGLTLDNRGNVYLTMGTVQVFSPAGEKIADIPFPQAPANICFGGPDEDILFVTARTGLYSLKMNVHGVVHRKP